jgi:hypothetical protein
MRTEARKLTLVQALALPVEDLEFLGRDDIDLTPQQLDDACRTWASLLGIGDGDGMASVRREVVGDSPLTVALLGPASVFVRWFKASEWGDYLRSELEGSDAWGWLVLERARGGCERLGLLAGQVGLRGRL